jgi:hypothetical protein
MMAKTTKRKDDLDPDQITAVLLADCWHPIVQGSFESDKQYFLHEDGVRWKEQVSAEGGTHYVACQAAALQAVRYAPQPPEEEESK